MYEPVFKHDQIGVQIHYYTNRKKYNPVHWHSAIELIYILNGNASVIIEQKEHHAIAGEFVIVDSNHLHEFRYEKFSMILVIHFSRRNLRTFVPNLDDYHFYCTRESLTSEKIGPYMQICKLLMELPLLHITQPFGHEVKSQAVAMEIFYELLNHFSSTEELGPKSEKADILTRLKEITEYINLHYSEHLTLEDVSSQFYLSKEYFSRFFKKHTGVSFGNYIDQVRMAHIYSDICSTQTGILELMERHGFSNYKRFSHLFREIYGCTPREVRRMKGGAA